jgi:hypothetical protein
MAGDDNDEDDSRSWFEWILDGLVELLSLV